tara:strand:+ start:1958 stop:2668 length:711 start_codon:yes stop_codon:yes gene_type:complete
MRLKILSLLTASVLLTGCMSEGQLKDKMAKVLAENPEVLTEAIEKNPDKFVTSLQKAIKDAQSTMAKRRAEEEQKQFEEFFENPLEPVINKSMASVGDDNAPIVLVEYSDFECPYCKKGYDTVNQLLERYKGKIKFVYKHLPLSFHAQALPAAQYFEALKLQSDKLAFAFHDKIFDNQQSLRKGEKFLQQMAKDVGADMNKLAKDIKTEAVQKRIEEDQAEAAKFGIQGTHQKLLF